MPWPLRDTVKWPQIYNFQQPEGVDVNSRRFRALITDILYDRKVQDIALDSNLCKNPSANNSQTVDAFGNAAFATTADSWAAQQLDQGLQPAAKQQLAGRCRLCKVDKPSTSATGCACCQLMTGMSPGALMHLLLFGRLRPDKTAVGETMDGGAIRLACAPTQYVIKHRATKM